ncbi:MAG: sulfatase-like hydrolase/transferase, partial [Planctomycetota bacterium]|nr:sulfatase-like hydrolase/transferase [Planctomycetota bacterium]
FFLYLAPPMPHLPISASQDFRGRSQAGLYGDVIEALDWSVGEVLRTLDERGLDENTLVIFTSDNGPWHELPDRMLQRGVERWHTGSTGPLRGAKGTTWEGGMRVPAIVRWPGVLAEGATVREVATTLDLFPTIAAATGAALPERELDGSNLLPRLAGEESWERDPFYYYRGDHLRAVRRGPWKLSLMEDGKPELHHLDRDPGEKYDESAAHPGVAAELYESMRAFADRNGGIVSALQFSR